MQTYRVIIAGYNKAFNSVNAELVPKKFKDWAEAREFIVKKAAELKEILAVYSDVGVDDRGYKIDLAGVEPGTLKIVVDEE